MTDFLNEIERYAKSDAAKFHMPGHKGNDIFCPAFDITELSFSDNLHNPSGIIADLESKIARIYGAKRSFISLNGSTGGILAMFLSIAAMKKKAKVLLARDCHKSAISGAILSGVETIGVYPGENIGFSVITPQIIDNALENYSADAVFITSPTYFGACADLKNIAKVCHDHGALLLVDSAHGAHFAFSDYLPEPASKFADLCVMSAHKTLASMTQTAFLHLNHCSLDEKTVQKALSLIETSSPSYVLMASAENGIEIAKKDWDEHVFRVLELRKKLTYAGVAIFSGNGSIIDPTRLYIYAAPFFSDGFALSAALENKGIFVEMADSTGIVLITSPFDKNNWYDKLIFIFNNFFRFTTPLPRKSKKISCFPSPVIMREAAFDSSEYIPLDKNAEGRIAAECIGIYPPGISVVFPGERLLRSDIYSLLEAVSQGARGVDKEGILVKKI
ncbi:MAG: aminotransferase class V-fold PLP-dependent enzyme [Clostridia bacterium]